MDNESRLSPQARDRAASRLRRVTLTVAGVSGGAMAVFAVTAAATIPGTSTTASYTPASTPAAAGGGTTTTPTDDSSTQTGSSGSTVQPAASTPQSSSSGSKVAVSGGSR